MKVYNKLFHGKVIEILFLALLSNLPAHSQDIVIDSIKQQFNRYQTKAFQEKIFVHTDKTFYVAGEIIWFKIYNVDAYFNKPLSLEKLAYIEITNKDQKPVLQTKVDLKDGSGNGSFLLPLSINSGTFILRAYTSWMKNFGSGYYFEQPITIVNSLKKPKWQELETPSKYDVQFFPEGGNLVDGLQSKIAFKVTDQYGKGINCKGIIINQKKDTVTSFKSLRFGMGGFLLTPVKDAEYKAIITLEDNQTITQLLPVAYSAGYVMQVTNVDSNLISVEVNSGNNDDNSPIYLLAQTRQTIKEAQVKMFQKNKVQFFLDRNKLGDGVSQFTLFNKARQPVCERLYFKTPKSKLNIFIKADKKRYATREKVTMDITAYDQVKPVASDMSLSVLLLDSLQSLNHSDIQTYLWLTSDIKGAIESPDYYFKNTDAEGMEAIDNLMLTQGWRRFKWEDVLQNKTPAFEFLPEYEGHIVTGKLIDKKSEIPVGNIPAYLSIPGNAFQFSNVTSQPNGVVRFVVKNKPGPDEIIVQTNNKTDSSYRIDILNPFSETFATMPFPQFKLLQSWKDQFVFHSINAQAQNFYTRNKEYFLPPDIPDSLSFYGKPDKTYYLDDYTRFVTMEEVMREYIPEVRVRKRNDQFFYEVKNTPYNSFFSDNPLILIDGVPVFDVNQILTVDPLKVKKIDIVTHEYYLGSAAYDGIVSYSTYQGDLSGLELNPNTLILEYKGPQLEREFYTPIYETAEQQNSRLPDYRTVLHWVPGIRINEQHNQPISFYTSDLPGKYAAVVEGITPGGLCGSAIITFDVEK
jgi:hypothetical protein